MIRRRCRTSAPTVLSTTTFSSSRLFELPSPNVRRGAGTRPCPSRGRYLCLLLTHSGGGALRFELDEQRHGLDQGQVGERLREIPEMLTCRGVDLLSVELQWPGE
jgi:hypothetical protein